MKTAFITGASRGIGARIVRRLCADGWQVAFTYLNSEDAASALARETGAWALKCDERDEQQVLAVSEKVLNTFRHLDAFIHNAGTAWTGLLQDMPSDQWDQLFAVHVKSAFLHAKAFLPSMISARSGNIVLISSMWGQVGASMEVAYSACKAAQIGLMKALAKEVGPSAIRVNCVAPGVINTDMMKGYSDEDRQALREETPLYRLGTPEDIANAVMFLLSEESSFITGQVLPVNGGMVI